MKTIIAPTDFSPVSLNAVNYAADMAQDVNAELLLMHTDNFFISTSDVLTAPAVNYTETYGAEQLENLRQRLIERTNNKINIRTHSVRGIVFSEIERICNREQPFIVVMATHSPSAIERLVMQSVTLYTAKHIQYPVLVVPDKLTYSGIKNIGLACDLENVYQEPVEILSTLVKTFRASLHVLHVKKSDEEERFAEMMLTRHYLHALNPVLHFIEKENIYEGLFSFVKDNAIDILILMHHPHKLLEKSAFKEFVLHPQLPVMTLQPE